MEAQRYFFFVSSTIHRMNAERGKCVYSLLKVLRPHLFHLLAFDIFRNRNQFYSQPQLRIIYITIRLQLIFQLFLSRFRNCSERSCIANAIRRIFVGSVESTLERSKCVLSGENESD